MLTLARGGLIERADLRDRIRTGLADGSLLVIAGAGYGKTTALRQALEGSGVAAAWVRCGDAGGDAGRLVGLILNAVRTASPGAADALAEQLATARQPIDPERATIALEQELDSVLVEPLAIVFDDAEALSGASAALDVIGRLLISESRLLRAVLASRQRPNIRLSRARATGRIAELGPSDLAFSAAECATYLQRATGHDPSPAEVEALVTATEGWPLGVGLAVFGGEAPAAGPSPSLAHEYFAEEVFDPLDEDLRRSLLSASTAPDLDIAERAGLGPPDGFAAAVDRRALFVRSTAAGSGRELHPLFREFLRSRFAADVTKDEQRIVARKIAQALAAADRRIEAVDYHLAGEDWPRAAAEIGRQGGALVRTASETVAGWIDALPAKYSDRPELQLLAGEIAHGQGRFAQATALCRAAVQGFDDAGAPATERFNARFALGDVLMAAGDLAGAGALSEVLEEPDAVGNLAARAVGVVAAAGLARQGRFADGRAVLGRALKDPGAQPLAGLAPTFESYYLDLPAGQLDDALAHAREAVATLEVADPTGRLPYALAYLVSILEERGDDAEALTVAQRTRAWSRRTGLSGWVGVVLAIRSANLRARNGDTAGAEADLADVPRDWAVWGQWELPATRAAIAAQRGEAEQTLVAAEQARRQARQRWPYFDHARCAALLAPPLAATGHPRRAKEIVEETIEGRIPGFSTARLHAVLAWLLHDEGDVAGSIAALTSAWNEAGDQIKHIIRREWPRIERPVWVALEHQAVGVEGTVDALAAAQPGAMAVASFTRHPEPAVRQAALRAAVASGHPEGIERLPELLRDPDQAVAAAARSAAQTLSRTPPPLAFQLLGRFELRRGAWLVDDVAWGRRVAQRVVRLLLCRGGGPVLEDELIEAFWPDKPIDSARRSVQVAVSCARAVLDPPGAQDSSLTCSERSYRLHLHAGDTVDADGFDRAAAAALSAEGDSRRPALLAAAALWTGEPLPEERYAEWSTPWRERLMDRYAEVLTALCDVHEEAGETAQLLDVARRLVELDPLNEAAHRRLIIAFARAGRRGHALRQFLECRRALVTSLGIEPDDETAALQRRVLAGDRL